MTAPTPSLSVVVPVLNEVTNIEMTLRHLSTALQLTPWSGAQIVVVDDGSSDGTSQLLDALATSTGIEVVHQANAGRLAAREAGLRAATGDLALLVDARVHLAAGALRHVVEEMAADPSAVIWNAHVGVASEGNPFAGFWNALTILGWRRYFSDPRRMCYGPDEFDLYPKGTTAFLAPRAWLLEDSVALESRYDDRSLASDDTALIRRLVRRSPINLSPDFSCTYFGREALRPFLRHAYARGTVFVDGYLGRGGQVGRAMTAGLALAPVAATVAVRRPRVAAAVTATAAVGLGVASRRSGAPSRDATALTLLLLPFGGAFGSGVLRGLVLYARASRRRRVASGL